ncbi:ArsR/SmtB family transcription factor [Candidatus Uabimicrobium amorphum]|uniref:Transcriptional regulator n=1 Tax=Uabimicrobium amorphum TaxID=2596890 RepID=A0A5S9F3R7_UABAM|nr:metalloregulator ArsR/SmtB family transcription factor [Candidatus Uabimicrobium amorphum]BBM84966.1 transcriptional regulator [Candidatus Uabimicrobium amorphum]
MGARIIVARELAALLKVLANADRIRIIEELRANEKDVSALQAYLGTSSSRVSQHLSLLKAHKLVKERREGKHKFYSLAKSEIADWLMGGLDYLENELVNTQALCQAVIEAKKLWTSED